MDYVNSGDAMGQKVIAKVIARGLDGRDLQIRIGGNPQRYARLKKKFVLRQAYA